MDIRPRRQFCIREARRQDAGQVVALWQEMMDVHRALDPRFRFLAGAPREFERHFLYTVRSREAVIYVAESGEKVVGYILGEMHARKPLYPAGTYGFVSDIAVAKAYRRMGIGRALAEQMLRWFRERSVTSVELFAAVENAESTAFWHALGFVDFLRLLRAELG